MCSPNLKIYLRQIIQNAHISTIAKTQTLEIASRSTSYNNSFYITHQFALFAN